MLVFVALLLLCHGIFRRREVRKLEVKVRGEWQWDHIELDSKIDL